MTRFHRNERIISLGGKCKNRILTQLRSKFWRDEDGAMIIFGILLFGMMLAIGGLSFDLVRYEAHRERLQSTLDRAVLAAASLTQELPAEAIVIDYLTKAGMEDFIDPGDIIVTQAINFRRVKATARIHVPLHHGTFEVFSGADNPNNELIAEATSVAEESIGDVEISLVLDISGSMNSYSRLTNLKTAAKDFLDTIYDAAQPDSVSTSIVPYSTQVNAGETLLSYITVDNTHSESHCINFSGTDFTTTAMDLGATYVKTLHLDPWTDENNTYGYAIGEDRPYGISPGRRDLPNPVCRDNGDGEGNVEIMPWSTDKSALKTYITGLDADGNTSTDIGVKWGAALLDPSMQTVLTGMIASDDVSANIAGRPFNYSSSDAMKIMVVMTDGVHTNQYYMGDYRDGNSFVWRYETGDNVYYSIWYDGEGSTPDTSRGGWTEGYWYCDWWYYGYCYDWDWQEGSYEKRWFVAYNTNYDGSGSTQYMWRESPYDGDSDETDNGANATRMTWDEVWADIPPEYFSDEVLYEMDTLGSTERNEFEYAIDHIGGTTKNTRFDNICAAVKANDVIVFTIGLEVPDSYDTRLRNCASSTSHYYDVDNLDIDDAFQSIAAQINQLRLTQ